MKHTGLGWFRVPHSPPSSASLLVLLTLQSETVIESWLGGDGCVTCRLGFGPMAEAVVAAGAGTVAPAGCGPAKELRHIYDVCMLAHRGHAHGGA